MLFRSLGTAIRVGDYNTVNLSGCLFYDNQAMDNNGNHLGIVWASREYNLNIDQCTFYDNGGEGSIAIRDDNTTGSNKYINVTNSIFYSDIIDAEAADELSVTYSLIYDIEGTGNFYNDPLFCDADSADFTLHDNSPCVGSGEEGANIGEIGRASARGRG